MSWKQVVRILGPFLGLIAVIGLFSILAPERFLTWYNFKTVAIQAVIVSLAALGATLVIISGGIDLSVGSVIALVTVVVALVLDKWRSPLLAITAGVTVGIICGALNGLMITVLRIVPFIATLGMLSIARGLAKYLAKEQKIDAPFSWLNHLMSKSPSTAWLILPGGVWILIISSLSVAFLLRYTRFGRYVFAIGSNQEAARLSGVPVRSIKLGIYTLSGLFTGLAGVMQFSRLTVGDPTVAVGRELDAIAAVVIGGGSLSGGEGSVLGSLVGAFITAFLRNGSNMIGVPNYVQEIIIGIIIVIAVSLDQWRHSKLT